MPKTINGLTPLNRQVITGDLLVVETPTGTRKAVPDQFPGKRLEKHIYTAFGGETEIAVPGFETATFSQVWVGVTPLDEYLAGDLVVPPGHYKADTAQSRVLLGDALQPGERALILYQ